MLLDFNAKLCISKLPNLCVKNSKYINDPILAMIAPNPLTHTILPGLIIMQFNALMIGCNE